MRTGSKTLDRWIEEHPGIVKSAYKDAEGWWIYLHRGLVSPSTETGTVHEYAVRDAIFQLNRVLPEAEYWGEE